MTESWYHIEGTTSYKEGKIHIMSLELLVKATSIEDACKKSREFLASLADFDPIKCEWQDD